MPFWKRALLHLARKKDRSVLLTLILFMMASFALTGIALKTGVQKEEKQVQKALGSSFRLEIDRNNPGNYETRTTDVYTSEVFVGPVITQDMIDKIANVEGIIDYATDMEALVWVDLKLRPGVNAEDIKDYNPESQNTYSFEKLQIDLQATMILPCLKSDLHENFRTGAFTMVEGRSIAPQDHSTAVISENLAKRNNLAVGSKIRIEAKEGLYQPSNQPSNTLGEPIDLTVTGLFKMNFEQEPSLYTFEHEYAENLIFTDYETGAQISSNITGKPFQHQFGEVTFFVDSLESLDAIMQRVKSFKNLNISSFNLRLDDTAYRATAAPLRQISVFATILILSGIVGCATILALLSHMWIKRRKRELGILRSIGAAKSNIILQLLLEYLMITAAALILTVALSGKIIRDFCPLVEKLASSDHQTQSVYTVKTKVGQLTPIITKNNAEPVHLGYTISWNMIVIVLIVTSVISMGSVTVSALQIMRMNPKSLLESL